jgi:hypothetical protein
MGSIAQSAKETLTTVAAGMTQNKKIADLQRDMKDAHSKQNNTTDFGVKIDDLDHWLKNVDEKNGRVGSHYLEDHIGRERVCFIDVTFDDSTDRRTDSPIRP